jgi:hypothetical protein
LRFKRVGSAAGREAWLAAGTLSLGLRTRLSLLWRAELLPLLRRRAELLPLLRRRAERLPLLRRQRGLMFMLLRHRLRRALRRPFRMRPARLGSATRWA